jgi:hypothetical protein
MLAFVNAILHNSFHVAATKGASSERATSKKKGFLRGHPRKKPFCLAVSLAQW